MESKKKGPAPENRPRNLATDLEDLAQLKPKTKSKKKRDPESEMKAAGRAGAEPTNTDPSTITPSVPSDFPPEQKPILDMLSVMIQHMIGPKATGTRKDPPKYDASASAGVYGTASEPILVAPSSSSENCDDLYDEKPASYKKKKASRKSKKQQRNNGRRGKGTKSGSDPDGSPSNSSSSESSDGSNTQSGYSSDSDSDDKSSSDDSSSSGGNRRKRNKSNKKSHKRPSGSSKKKKRKDRKDKSNKRVPKGVRTTSKVFPTRDVSVGKENELFGKRITSPNLDKLLCPEGMRASHMATMTDIFGDAVGLPGMYGAVGDGEAGSRAEEILERVAENMNLDRKSTLKDNGYKNTERNSLLKVKSSESLFELIDEIIQVRDAFFENQEVLIRTFMQEREYTHADIEDC